MSQSDEMRPCFFDGSFVLLKDANVNIRTHALQYGTGCFGGIRAYWNSKKKNLFLFRVQDHYKRLQNSTRVLYMQLPHTLEDLANISLEVLRRGKWEQNVYLRPIVYKSAPELPPRLHNMQDSFALYAIALDDYLDTENGLSACFSSWRRLNDNSMPTRIKSSGGYLNSALAKSEAMQNNFDEAIFLDSLGFVSEGSAENLFIVKNGKLITPDVTSDILEGITRHSVIQIARDLGIEVVERKIGRTELYLADEMFFSGTGVQIAWIKSVDHRIIGDGKKGKITASLQKTYFDIVTGNGDARYSHWLTEVY